MPTKMHLCNECNQCSSLKPKPLNWGHECWAHTEDGRRIVACESHIEQIPVADTSLFDVTGEAVTPWPH